MDKQEVVDLFTCFLPENYTVLARNTQENVCFYWAIQYREVQNDPTGTPVSSGNIYVSEGKLYIYTVTGKNSVLEKAADEIGIAFQNFKLSYPHLCGECKSS